MRKTFFAALFAVAITTSGCVGVVRVPGVHASAAESGKKCPPGHEWSDGSCHAKGKGHDPEKHRK
jgi:hypothetical protein